MVAYNFVVAIPGTPTTFEAACKTRLEGQGHTVTYVDAPTAPVSGRPCIIFESISAAALNAGYKTHNAGLLIFENGVWDDLALHTGTSTSTSLTTMNFITNTDPVSAGLQGANALYTGGSATGRVLSAPITPTNKIGGGTLVAWQSTGTTDGALWRFAAGDALADGSGNAAGRRIAWGLNDQGTNMFDGVSAPRFTTAGISVFDAAVSYIASGANAAPTANAGVDTSVNVNGTVNLNGSGSDADGTIASYTWRLVSSTGGATGTLSSTTAEDPTVTAGATAGTLTYGLIVTDNLGLTSTEDTVTITVSGLGTFSRPTGDVAGTTTGWTGYNTSGQVTSTLYTSLDEPVPDSLDYIESPPSPTYSAEVKIQHQPLTAPSSTAGHWVDCLLWVPAPATTGTCRIRVYNGATNAVVAEFTQAVTNTPTAYRFTLSGTQAGNMNYSNIQIGYAFQSVA